MLKAKTCLSLVKDLFLPRYCACCGRNLLRDEDVICLGCHCDIPRTNYHLEPYDNNLALKFRGRFRIECAAAWFFFAGSDRYRHAVHSLKYNGRKDIGHNFGYRYGKELSGTPFCSADCLIPVPLHPSKLRKRGFNQSLLIAEGLSEALGIKVCDDILGRRGANPTQTKLHGYRRWENVEDVFSASNPEKLQGKHIILVDDVITTGSTIDAAAAPLSGVDCRISVLALATSGH